MEELSQKVAGCEEYSSAMDAVRDQDLERLGLTKEKPEGAVAFTSLGSLDSFDYCRVWLEPLRAFASPQKYYQDVLVDGKPLRCNWVGGWTRSVCFTSSGLILLFRATEREKFGTKERFQFYYLVELPKEKLSFECTPPVITVKAENAEVEGVNLLTGEAEKHSFSFTFVDKATDRSFVSQEQASRSGMYRRVVAGQGSRLQDKKVLHERRAERFVSSVQYFAFHPLLLKSFSALGFPNRLEMQKSAPKLVEELVAGLGVTCTPEESQEEPRASGE